MLAWAVLWAAECGVVHDTTVLLKSLASILSPSLPSKSPASILSPSLPSYVPRFHLSPSPPSFPRYEYVQALGATDVIDYCDADLTKRVLAVTGGRGVDGTSGGVM